MIEAEVRLSEQDLRKLEEGLLNIKPAIEEAKKDIAITLRNLVIGNTPVGIRKKPSGTIRMKQSWSEPAQRGAGGLAFGSSLPYARRLEEGTYPGVGPRTIRYGKGIYSRQAPGGMVGPVLDSNELVEKITESVTKRIMEGLRDV